MNKLKIAGLGWEGYTGQIARIKQGFESLGHELTYENPNIIFCNDPSQYVKAIQLKEKNPKSFLILNFLDIPWHFPGVLKKITNEANLMKMADAVTVISQKVKKDLSGFYDGKIEVIYNPAKDVYLNQNIKKKNNFLYVGRANDPIKRIKLAYESLKIFNKENDLVICGTEDPKFGKYMGVVNDEILNELYNKSKFVLLPSKAEGIGLSMIEAMICGSVPIMCSDNSTAKEFSPLEFISEPSPISIKNKIDEINDNYNEFRNLSIKYGKKYKEQFNKKTIAKNILEIYKKKIN
tara:strand:+ start:50 stop:928 length:879 start_codon:yes stop_codon:yes gene_type:complete